MIQNAKTLPKRYFGLHMVEGVAEYNDGQAGTSGPYRILVNEATCKQMDSTYEGKPVYVRHVDDVNLDKLQEEADGYVVKSFFNKADGRHWVEFIVVSDKGHSAIQSGWKLSNAYIPKKFAGGGHWHGVEYLKSVEEAEYEHLALVPNPRYEESIVLTPDEFQEYNQQKESELKKLSNSLKEGAKSMFNFFKKTKVENAADFESMSVILPKSGKEKTLAQIINDDDAMEMNKKEEHPMADPEHHVMVGEEKMKINDLIKKYHDAMAKHHDSESKKHDDDAMKSEEAKKPEEKEEAKKPKMDEAEGEEKKEDDMSDEEAKKKALELAGHEEEEHEKKKNEAHFEKLKNAETLVNTLPTKIEFLEDQIARGKARYGSGN